MNQTVQSFIDQKNKEYEAVKMDEKQKFYEKHGLSKNVYMDEEVTGRLNAKEKAEKYPYIDYINGSGRRYRLEYPQFTDSEFEAMKKAQERVDAARDDAAIKPETVKERTSTLSTVLVVLAVVLYIAALIAGITAGQSSAALKDYYSYRSNSFDLEVAIIYWGVGLFAGTVMLGFADIVDHLNKQTDLLRAIIRK